MASLRGLIAKGISGLSDIGGVTRLMREEGVLQYGEKTTLISGQEEERRYTSVTTALHESDELEFVRLAKAASQDKSGAIPDRVLQQKIDTSGLDLSDAHGLNQRAAIERLGRGGRFGMVIAAAGAGKTSALRPLVSAWTELGRDVWGTSPASRQTDELVDAGINPKRLRAFGPFIDSIQDGKFTLTANSVVAVDEWATVGTRRGLELLKLRERIGFSIVTLGDDKQTKAIEAGSVTDLSYRALGREAVPVIMTTKRQVTEREQKIVGLLREGRAAEALDMKRSDGSAEMVYGGPEGVIARVAKLYAERLVATGEAPSISAPTNLDAHRISEAVRVEQRKLGHVGADLLTIKATDGTREYAMKLAKGDQIRLFRSTGADYGNGTGGPIGRNGSVLEVIDINAPSGIKLKAKNGRIGTVPWAKLVADTGSDRMLLAYGTAMTIHTAQGSTAKEHIFALPQGSQSINGASGYTASTRHRSVAYLVTSEMAERSAVRESRPINDPHEITLDDKWANVARAMAYQPENDSALALLERAVKLKRWTTGAFHRAMTPGGGPPSDVPDNVLYRHLGASMKVEVRQMAIALRRGMAKAQGAYRGVTEGLTWSR